MMCEEDLIIRTSTRGKWHIMHHGGCSLTFCGRILKQPATTEFAERVPSGAKWCIRCRAMVGWECEFGTEWAAKHSWLSDALGKVRRA